MLRTPDSEIDESYCEVDNKEEWIVKSCGLCKLVTSKVRIKVTVTLWV